ncbi:hypothetical protein O0L34_g2290 [Tuta absoluta]|nr:hypothetical protein O0L34_g2290 [Tuta absoluta]
MAEANKEDVPDLTQEEIEKHVNETNIKERLDKYDGKFGQYVQIENPKCMKVLMQDMQCMQWVKCQLLEQKLARDTTKDPNELRLLNQVKQEIEGMFEDDQEPPILVQVPDIEDLVSWNSKGKNS